MRPILICALLLIGLSAASAAPEPEYAMPLSEKLRAVNRTGALIEIQSSLDGTDRLGLTALEPDILRIEAVRRQDDPGLKVTPASADVDIPVGDTRPGDTQSIGDTQSGNRHANSANNQTGQPSLADLCNALFTSAQNNDLPVPFFANLLWQESRLRADDVSKKGAQGIAQFMPEVATETGLANPFDPMQAIPASARFLQKLRLQFGNLGFVAAAYNAGAHRVIEWLENRASLPRETRVYVVRVTGLSVETWRSMPIDNDALAFVQHLPCRRLPAFADVEQQILQRQPAQQIAQAQLDQAKAEQDERDEASEKTAAASAAAHPARKSAAEDEHASEVKHAIEIKHAAEAKHAEENKRAAEGKHAGESKRAEESKRATESKHADASKQAAEDKRERARDEAHGTAHDDRHPAKSEASHAPHGAREKHKSA
ncbi:MAG TPA: transglycosylase SLT domain-containing protein [Xanthobacteraceae bacterium]